ncbi:MAG TPA: hypothetical protein VFA51_09175 [Candidatus Udaeobacter sp.]|nr:hypothetical protein [Candidatus Udaeobacter sp.]
MVLNEVSRYHIAMMALQRENRPAIPTSILIHRRRAELDFASTYAHGHLRPRFAAGSGRTRKSNAKRASLVTTSTSNPPDHQTAEAVIAALGTGLSEATFDQYQPH